MCAAMYNVVSVADMRMFPHAVVVVRTTGRLGCCKIEAAAAKPQSVVFRYLGTVEDDVCRIRPSKCSRAYRMREGSACRVVVVYRIL
jgi:hypothetical protein